MTTDKLTYEELKLGEKAKQAFLEGKPTEYIKEHCPIYLNTREVYAGLNVTDLAIAYVLGGMNGLLIGDTGCGKSQLASDFHNYYFGGAKKEKGHGVTVEGHPDLDIYSEVFADFDRENMKRVLNQNKNALFFNLEEITRCPPISQNQFYAVGNGRLIHNGVSTPIGKDGYRTTTATANFGNGEFKGTFDSDKAFLNRFGVILDFDYKMFQPTEEDEMLINSMREADPGIKRAPIRDLSDKIMKAHKEISQMSKESGLEAFAVVNYLRSGLRNCQGPNQTDTPQRKEKTWPYLCQDCFRNTEDYLCSLVRAPQQRTIDSLLKYASSLQFLAKLKNPKQEINSVDLIFKSFELTGAYQALLNPGILKRDYLEANPRMMQDIVKRLKTDFNNNQDVIMTSLEEAQKGRRASLCKLNGETYQGYNELNEEEKSGVEEVTFTDNQEIGLDWVNDAVDLHLKINKIRNKK